MQKKGDIQDIIVLIGGATAMIGDPTGRKSERAMLSEEEVRLNVIGIEKDVKTMFKHASNVKVVNNLAWTQPLSAIDLLRELGSHFSVKTMLRKQSVKTRLDGGLSFSELSYQVLQANDFLHLYNEFGCSLQIGGSDQYGNIGMYWIVLGCACELNILSVCLRFVCTVYANIYILCVYGIYKYA